MARGFAVIDVETTGLRASWNDRIVELAVVHVSPNGEIEGRWETVVNPMRDMGAQQIHGVSALMASRGPTFEGLAPQLLGLMSGRVPVAHNAVFDADFVGAQMAVAGYRVPSYASWLCTMRLAASVDRRIGRSLEECCIWAGVRNAGPHTAGGDAVATAQLLQVLMQALPDRSWWEAWLDTGVELPLVQGVPVEWVPRETAAAPPRSLVQRVKVQVDGDSDVLNVDYLGMLDRVLLDLQMFESEIQQLVRLADELGIGQSSLGRMHRAYFDGFVSAAWADGVLIEEELSDIRKVGATLGIDPEEVEAAIRTKIEGRPLLTSGFVLHPGDMIVITGETKISRPEWFAILERLGYVAKDSMSKAAKVLVAADPDSMSGKAQTARRYGIPIITESGLERLLHL